jgi:DNA mismatch repair protein MSH6
LLYISQVCSIVSSGTRTYCFLDDTRCFNGSDELRCSNGPLLSIREVLLPFQEEGKAVCEYGITIVDAVRSVITVGQFADDVLRSRMLTLLTTFTPSEILLEEGNSSKELIQLIQMTQTARIEKVRAEEEFPQSNAILEKHRNALSRSSPCHPWDERETVEELSRKRYFSRRKSKKNTVAENDSWPEVLFACIQGEAKLALSSLGAALFYLQRALIDEELFTFGCVKAYIPPGSPNVPDEQSSDSRREANSGSIVGSQSVAGTPTLCELSAAYAAEADGLLDIGTNDKSVASAGSNSFMDNNPHAVTPEENSSEHHPPCPASTDHMQVDGTTIENLELLFNQSDKTSQNSLWAKLNHTKTPHGFRLLRAWLLRPLFRRVDIQRRQDAVAELCVGSAALAMTEARPMLQKVGDLERLLSRVHAMGGSGSSSANPNERAMLYEGAIYTQRKMNDFQKLIQGLYCAGKVIDLFSPENCTGIENCLLRKIVRRQRDGGCFPDNLEEELRWFSSNSECFDENYDAACADIERIEQELQRYKSEMCRQLGRNANAQWTYINTKPDSRDKYLIELPVSIPVPQDFYIKAKRGSGAKQVNKYRTSFVEGLVNDLEAALEEKKAGEERSTQLLFQKFDSLRTIWSAVAHATAMLDALGSLAYVSSMPDMVRPTVLDENSLPTLHYRQGRHFCVDVTHDGVGFIPNDLTLGGCPSVDGKSSSRVLLLSGPNMGGKS